MTPYRRRVLLPVKRSNRFPIFEGPFSSLSQHGDWTFYGTFRRTIWYGIQEATLRKCSWSNRTTTGSASCLQRSRIAEPTTATTTSRRPHSQQQTRGRFITMTLPYCTSRAQTSKHIHVSQPETPLSPLKSQSKHRPIAPLDAPAEARSQRNPRTSRMACELALLHASFARPLVRHVCHTSTSFRQIGTRKDGLALHAYNDATGEGVRTRELWRSRWGPTVGRGGWVGSASIATMDGVQRRRRNLLGFEVGAGHLWCALGIRRSYCMCSRP